MEKFIYRPYILVRYKYGLTPTEIFDELRLCYQDNFPSHVTVWRWWTRFDEGNFDLEDMERPGRPITAVTTANIDLVRELIELDCHITYEQIEEEASLAPPSIYEIIYVHLKMRKVVSRWVPYELTCSKAKACCQLQIYFGQNRIKEAFTSMGHEGYQEILYLVFVFILIIVAILSFIRNYSIIPVIGAMCCLYLMIEIPPISWLWFFIWMGIGLVFYAFYGSKQSKLNDNRPTN